MFQDVEGSWLFCDKNSAVCPVVQYFPTSAVPLKSKAVGLSSACEAWPSSSGS